MRKIIYLLLFPALAFSQSKLDGFEDLIKGKQYDKAEIKITVYLESHPKDLEALELLSDTYGHQKNGAKP